MRLWIPLCVLATFLMAAFLLAKAAPCSDCIPTFCGHSTECPQNCVCVIPTGEATGFCAGLR
jgi:hypothetical protein